MPSFSAQKSASGIAAAVVEGELPSSATVAVLRAHLAEHEGVEASCITLICRGNILKDPAISLEHFLDSGGKVAVVYLIKKVVVETSAAMDSGQATNTASSVPAIGINVGADRLNASGLHDWMSRLPDTVSSTRSITELALPAAHNAGAQAVRHVPERVISKFVGAEMAKSPLVLAFAQPMAAGAALCQSASILELLQLGTRVLDLRIDMHEDELYVCHTVVCDLTLEAALDQIVSFLTDPAHSKEVVVVTIRRDFEATRMCSAEDWGLAQAVVAGILESVGVAGDDSALNMSLQQLQETGTRTVVLFDVQNCIEVNSGIRLTKHNHIKSWRDETRTVEQMLRVLDEWSSTGKMSPQRGTLKFLEVALPGVPSSSAPAALTAFREWIKTRQLSIGVMMDFPDTETVLSIVRKNMS